MGIAQSNLDAPVMKGTSGIPCSANAKALALQESACIYCEGRRRMPHGLRAVSFENYTDRNNFEAAEKRPRNGLHGSAGARTYAREAAYNAEHKARQIEIVKNRKKAAAK